MTRPTAREQEIIKIRNNLIRDLVVNKNFTQTEVAKYFNINRATVSLIINEKL